MLFIGKTPGCIWADDALEGLMFFAYLYEVNQRFSAT